MYGKLRLVIYKNIVSNISEINRLHPCFWTHLGLKYSSRLPKYAKYIQTIDRNARMSRIFMDSVDKSASYIRVFSRNKYICLDAVYYSTRTMFLICPKIQ